jgi:hypothetical protein
MLKLLFRLLNVECSHLLIIKSTDNMTEHFLCSQIGDRNIISERLDMLETSVEQVFKY